MPNQAKPYHCVRLAATACEVGNPQLPFLYRLVGIPKLAWTCTPHQPVPNLYEPPPVRSTPQLSSYDYRPLPTFQGFAWWPWSPKGRPLRLDLPGPDVSSTRRHPIIVAWLLFPQELATNWALIDHPIDHLIDHHQKQHQHHHPPGQSLINASNEWLMFMVHGYQWGILRDIDLNDIDQGLIYDAV